MKFRAEQELRASGLSWTIVRCAAFMETWVGLTGAPLLHGEKAMVFGRGRNPMNFVSAHDVAAYVEIALRDPSLRGSVLTVGGPENLTMRELVATFAELTGTQLRVRRFPRPMLRLGSHLLARRNPMLAGHMRGGVTVDTRDQRFDPSANLHAFPSVRLTTVKELIRRDYMKETAVSVAPAPAARA
jgi:NADH dehydrogenase